MTSDAGCLSVGCGRDQDLIGCTAAQSDMSGIGGVQNMGNVCTAQRYGDDGDLSVSAMCADQPLDGHELRCESVASMDAEKDDDSGNYVSSVQCPVKTVMFDCNSFLNGRTSDCTTPSANTGSLFGECYYKKRKKSKVYCIATGDNKSVRAQATCCELE